MSNILQLRDAIVSAMKDLSDPGERFAGVTVAAHGGDFDTVRELEDYRRRAPAVLISPMRVNVTHQGGEPIGECVFGAFVMVEDKPGNLRSGAALALVENVLDYLGRFPTKNFGSCAGKIKNLIARNLYSGSFDKKGVALWGIFWEQTVELVFSGADESVDLHSVNVDYETTVREDEELGDAPEATDIVHAINGLELDGLLHLDGYLQLN